MANELWRIDQGDCLPLMNAMPTGSVDLVFGSPPYTDARTYGLEGVSRGCQEWVDWMLEVTEQAVRVSRGLVLWVVAGVQRKKCYWPACEGLCWEWWKRGGQLWRPCIWWKVDNDEGGTGIPGSGGKQWLRNDWEYVLAFKKDGWLPYADPLLFGHAPVTDQVGGAMSNRNVDGKRSNETKQAQGKRQWSDDPWKTATRGGSGVGGRERNGDKKIGSTRRANGDYKKRMDVTQGHDADGNLKPNGKKCLPKTVNPGNVLGDLPDDLYPDLVGGIVKARVGGGHMGNKICHRNEAPLPEKLAAFFCLSFSPPGGRVLEPFMGSGTTLAVAVENGREGIGFDIRQSQCDLAKRRLESITPTLFA